MATIIELGQKVKAKYPDYADMSDFEVGQKIKAKYPNDYADFTDVEQPKEQKQGGTLLTPLKEGISGLGTLYGGGEQGIANKLVQNVKAGASDIQKGTEQGGIKGLNTAFKGILKSGIRTAGDIAGTIFAPVGALMGATGINKVFDKVGELSQHKGGLMDRITNIPAVQKFATTHPNAGEDFGRILNIGMAGMETGKIEPKTTIPRTIEQVKNKLPDVVTKSVEQMRAEKIKSGYEEQNTRLKSVDKSFNKNTRTYKNEDGTTTKVTPIDTFTKHNITPKIEKGSIQMGDYQTSQGALGKIREKIGELDSQIETKIKDSGKGISIEEFKQKAIAEISADETLRQSGKVATTIKKLETVFEDYKNSYGEILQETEINSIRKVMNRDYSPETMDVSRVLGDTARDIVYNVTPDKIVKKWLREQGELLSAKKYAESMNGTKVTGGRLGNMALRTTGAIIGSSIDKLPIVGPILGMIGGEYAARALQQSQFKSFGAETKALFQRSKSIEPIMSAKIIPNKAISPIIPPIKTKVNGAIIAKKATELTKKNGGVTINLDGDVPQKGFAYSPFKNIETIVSEKEFSQGHVDKFIETHYNELNKEGSHLGVWIDDGKVYMDISKVIPNEQMAVMDSIKNNQIGLFDLSTFETKLIKNYEKINNTYTYKREISATNQEGNTGTIKEEGSSKIIKDLTLKGQDAKIQDAAIAKYEADPKKLLNDYRNKFDKIVVSADEARKLFKDVGYNGTNSSAVQEVVSQLSKDIFKHNLNVNKGDFGVLYSGMAGAGKSSALKNIVELNDIINEAASILDSNLAKTSSASARIEEIIKVNKIPSIIHIYREPLDAFENGIIKRMNDSKSPDYGRVVPIKHVNLTAHQSRKVLIEIYDIAKDLGLDDSLIYIVNNSLGYGNAKLITLDELVKIKIPDNLETLLINKAKELYGKGQITKEQLEGFLK